MKPIEVANIPYLVHITHFRLDHPEHPKYLQELERAIEDAWNTNQIRMHEKYFSVDKMMKCPNFDMLYTESIGDTEIAWVENFTRVSLLDKNTKKVVATGYAFCSPKEKNFNKRLGVRIALSRAIKQLEQ